MQHWAQQRCIVSKCVVYAKKADTHLGICFFALQVGLEPQVRVRGARKALPVAALLGVPAKPALWGEEKPRHSWNFPLAENVTLWLVL